MKISKDEAILKLKKVRDINIQIKHIDRRITEFRSRLEYSGIRYTDMPKSPKGSYKENAIDKCLERIEILEEEKTELLLEIDITMEPFYSLPENLYKVLCLKYIKNLFWYEISEVMVCDERTCQRYENKAFRILEN